ncbi:membrane protein [Actinomadura cremea]|nr:membrane protein [Actinomadura cremea]
MRRALAGLTTRGRSFVAAGLTAIACAFALGERDLLRAGVLVLVLPLLCTLAVARTRYRLACARRLAPGRLPVGRESRIDLRLENVSRLPSGLLMVEDRIPYALGGRARFLIDRIEPQGSRELRYRVRSDVRGKYRVGPLTVRLTDPFGMVELVRSFSAADSLTVTPEVVPLRPGRLSGAWTGGGDSLARAVAAAGEDDVAPRDYRHGDDLRRVHWRSTARRGELMVRREEQHWQSSGTLFLDTRRNAHWGDGPGGTFERAVSVTASIGVHLVRTGMRLRYVTDVREELPAVASADGAFEGLLLDALAVVRRSPAEALPAEALAAGAGGGERGGLVIAVFGALSAEDAGTVASRWRGATRVAVLVGDRRGDEAAGGGAADADAAAPRRAADVLRAGGWRVVSVRTAAELAEAWARAGEDPARAGRRRAD